ncbi:MAG TPA: glycosyltransferase [Gaiellaceae bacterium]|nr:glycosyltransferase [Gaiellaceae bacterium]
MFAVEMNQSAAATGAANFVPGPPAAGWHLVAYSDSTVVGGAEISMGTVLGALDPKIQVTVLGPHRVVVEAIAAHRPGAAAVLVAPLYGLRGVHGFVAHMRAFRRLRPDIVQVNMPASWFALYPALTALLTPGPRVILVEHAPAPIPARREWRVKRFASRRSGAHVAVGHRSAALIEADLELSPGALEVIHNGVADEPVEPASRQAPGPLVGGVGRLEPEKGFDVLVRAVATLPGVTMTVLGEGDERARLTALATELGIGDRLLLPGWSSAPRPQIASFDAFVLCSLTESFPLVVPEAMLAGTPIVASDVGSVSEAVENGVTGLLVPAGDPEALAAALRRVLSDPGLADRLRTAAREKAVREFTAGAMARAYTALYDRLLPR